MCYARYTTGDGPNPTLFTCHTISTKNMADMGTSEVTAMGRMCEWSKGQIQLYNTE